MVGAQVVWGDAIAKLGEEVGGGGRAGGRGSGSAGRAEERLAQFVVSRRFAHRPVKRVVVEVVEGGGPGVGAESFQGRPGARVAETEEIGLGMPGEAVVVVGHPRMVPAAPCPPRPVPSSESLTGDTEAIVRRTGLVSRPPGDPLSPTANQCTLKGVAGGTSGLLNDRLGFA